MQDFPEGLFSDIPTLEPHAWYFFVHRANIKKISNLSQRFFYPKTVRASFDTAYFARAGPIITQTAILAMVPTSQLTPTL